MEMALSQSLMAALGFFTLMYILPSNKVQNSENTNNKIFFLSPSFESRGFPKRFLLGNLSHLPSSLCIHQR